MDDLERSDVATTEATYALLARACAAAGDADAATAALARARAAHVAVRRRAYAPVLALRCARGALDRALKAAAERLDHGMLNEHPGLELPSLENLCLWFARTLQPEWPGLCRIQVARPTINERCVLTL